MQSKLQLKITRRNEILFEVIEEADKGLNLEQWKEIIKNEGLELADEVSADIAYIKTLSSREYLLHKKYNELEEYQRKNSILSALNMGAMMMDFKDIEYAMTHDDNEVELLLCNGNKKLTEHWILMRIFISTAYHKVGGGRNLNYIIRINGKYAGVVALTSDVISIGCRDTFIGWDTDTKHKNLGRIGIGSTIVPTQPLGYWTTGGKLMSLMFFSSQFRNDWEERYGEKLVGCTTTSLYGIQSQYNGMKKYWKTLGETKGNFIVFPSDPVYNKIKDWIKHACKLDPDIEKAYNDLFFVSNDSGMVTNQKAKNLSFYFKHSRFREKYQKHSLGAKDLTIGYKRGVYFARLYDNTIDYLNDRIEEKDLVLRDTFDFNIDKPNEIFAYWKRKWAKNRFEKLIKVWPSGIKEQYWISIKDLTKAEFIEKYQ